MAAARESLAARRRRTRKIILELSRLYPKVECGLAYRSPLELLVAVILSAQCTDVRVNLVTPELFAEFPDCRALAEAEPAALEAAIRTTGFFRNKAKNIRACCRALLERHGGRIPRSLDELVKLPGIGRKTANVILGELYGLQGVVVDTHVRRISRHLGLTASEDPVKIEKDLEKVVPEPAWNLFSHLLIWHGRMICIARRPDCRICPLASGLCPAAARKSPQKSRR
jgi:endonuclease-3